MALLLSAPAKVNLGLRVLGRRPDGYCELDTLFHALQLCDDLVMETGACGVELEVVGAQLDPGPENLVRRAALSFFGATGSGEGMRFHLHKRIPVGAGLGGGSSDAAATLLLLNHLSDPPLQLTELQGLATGLGADVGFFLKGGTQRGRGRGELLTPQPHLRLHFLLILPPFGTSTAAVYKNYPAQLIDRAQKASIPEDKAVPSKGLAVPEGLRNDLEGAAMRLHPDLGGLRARIVDAGFPEVCMSGSGSALYLVSETEDQVQRAEEKLGFLGRDGVRLLPTRSAEAQARRPRRVSWPARPRPEQGG